MSEIIKNLELTNPDEEILEGTFTSNFFRNEDGNELSVYMENSSLIEYAEKCIEYFNSLSDDVIDKICKGIAESSTEEYRLENVRDILEYCWFTSLVTIEDDEIYYLVEGEGEWGESVGFVIKKDTLAYVGIDYEEYL
ncbi:MAG: hypothetical protein K2G83_03835 [Ruminococcus sp.]|nr:hypothetical protein [Ruminococcus sp.]